MKKLFLLSVMLGAMSLSAVAQDDDMYFVPTKKSAASQRSASGSPTDVYHSGSSRSVEDYNRWGSSYEVLPVDTGDIISFAGVEGIYPDSLGDFKLTQQMARFDGYEPSQAYWAGYSRGYSDWAWHSPWYYSSFYPWYDSWYWDPWYYGYWGWGDPWYYSHWGWGGYYSHWYSYYPHYYGWGGGGYVSSHSYSPGTENHGRITGSAGRGFASGRTHTYSAGTFGSSRNGSFGGSRTTGSYGGRRTSASSSTSTRTRTAASFSGGTYSNSNGNFGGSSSGSSFTPTRSAASSVGSSSGSSGGGGGSFGGSRSGGGGGGGRSGGGGFGSGRR